MSISQNKKIALSVVAMFFVSFASMLLFLRSNGSDTGHIQTEVLGADHTTSIELTEPSKWEEEIIYKGLIDEINTPFVVTNVEGEMIFAESDYCELISTKCEYVEGKKIFDFINSRDLTDIFAHHTKMIQNRRSIKGMGPYRMLNDDEEILVLMSAYPILDDKDEVEKIIYTVRDLTQKVQELSEEESGEESGGENGRESGGENPNENWIKNLYPSVNEMENIDSLDKTKLIVDKISFIMN